MGLRIFLTVWAILIFGVDYLLLESTRHQWESRAFVETQGTIERCKLKISHGSKGSSSYSVAVQYSYNYNGRKYASEQFRYGKFGSSDHDWAANFVDSHPKGSPVTVYCDPAQPGEAVLIRGLQGYDLLLALFLAPFNAIGLLGLGSWFAGRTEHRDGGPLVYQGYPNLVQRLVGALVVGLGSIGCLAFPLIFVLAFTVGLHPTLGCMTLVWGVLGLIGAFLAIQSLVKPVLLGLVVDRGGNQLIIQERAGRRTIALDDIRSCRLKNGPETGADKRYTVELETRQGSQAAADMLKLDQARRVADELAKALNVPLQPQ